jgi:hypothetical protein
LLDIYADVDEKWLVLTIYVYRPGEIKRDWLLLKTIKNILFCTVVIHFCIANLPKHFYFIPFLHTFVLYIYVFVCKSVLYFWFVHLLQILSCTFVIRSAFVHLLHIFAWCICYTFLFCTFTTHFCLVHLLHVLVFCFCNAFLYCSFAIKKLQLLHIIVVLIGYAFLFCTFAIFFN